MLLSINIARFAGIEWRWFKQNGAFSQDIIVILVLGNAVNVRPFNPKID